MMYGSSTLVPPSILRKEAIEIGGIPFPIRSVRLIGESTLSNSALSATHPPMDKDDTGKVKLDIVRTLCIGFVSRRMCNLFNVMCW